MRHVARCVSGSSSRKLAQPFVPQKSRVLDCARYVRRRSRRIAEARPVADVAPDRVIMVLVLVLSGAPSSRDGRSAARPWVVRALLAPATLVFATVCVSRERGLGARTGSRIGTFGPTTIRGSSRSGQTSVRFRPADGRGRLLAGQKRSAARIFRCLNRTLVDSWAGWAA